jgi:hypothetical protein
MLLSAWSDVGALEAAYAAATVFLGYFVLGTAGFGSALVAVPLLSWVWPLTLVVPLTLLIDVPASLLHAGLNRRLVAWREIPRLLPTAALGSIAGVLLIQWTRAGWLLALLGLYIAAVGLRGLQAQRGGARWRPAPVAGALPAGFGIGLVEGLFGTAGPVVLAWLMRRIPDPQVLRATVPPAILIVASVAIASAAASGLLASPRLWAGFLGLLPVAVLGVLAGHRLARRVAARHLAPVIHGLLVVSGLVLVGRALVPAG